MRSFIKFLHKETWSPYAAGILLGLVGILAVVAGDRLLGASGAVATLAGNAVRAAGAQGDNVYFKFVLPQGLTWDVVLLIGVFLGGMIGALSSGTFRLRWNDDLLWRKVIGPQTWKRLSVGFVGAVILQYGASLAGGCTSGLAISGGMLLAPSAFLFMAGMFASGIVVTLLIYRKRY